MVKNLSHAWYYRIAYADNAFAVYLNDRLVGNIQKSSSGPWPVHVTVNNRLYVFSKASSLKTFIELTDIYSSHYYSEKITLDDYQTEYYLEFPGSISGGVYTLKISDHFDEEFFKLLIDPQKP